MVGPNLRGSGVKWDIRKDMPYSVYPELDFEVPVGTGEAGALGVEAGGGLATADALYEASAAAPRLAELPRRN